MTDLSALIARLEAAEAGSRELDESLWIAFDVPCHNSYVPPVTTSLDAALALAERVLPEATQWEVCTPNGGTFVGPFAATISAPEWFDVSRDDWETFTHGEASGNTPALALCIATLRAKLDGYAAEGEVNKNPKAQEG